MAQTGAYYLAILPSPNMRCATAGPQMPFSNATIDNAGVLTKCVTATTIVGCGIINLFGVPLLGAGSGSPGGGGSPGHYSTAY